MMNLGQLGTAAAIGGAVAMFAGLVLPGDAAAAPCGTVGTPGPCSLDVGGTVRYDVSNLTFVNANAAGGGTLYDGEDISVDLSIGGGLSAVLTFGKIPDADGLSFFVNPGQTSGFIFSYDLTVTALSPGSIEFLNITTSVQASSTANGLASVQGIVAGQVNCQVVNVAPFNICDLDGPGPLDVGDILTLTGNAGNAAVLTFTNGFDVDFTRSTDVPEPGSLALLLTALGAVALRRRG